MLSNISSYCTQKTQFIFTEVKDLAKAEIELIKTKPVRTLFLLASAIACIAIGFFGMLNAIILDSLLSLSVGMGSSALAGVSLGKHIVDVEKGRTSLYKKAHPINTVQNKEIALVLEATDDHNDAFKFQMPIQLEKKYPLAFKNISNINQFSEAIDESIQQNNKIKVLWIRAHGSPQSMTLGKADNENEYLAIAGIAGKRISIFNVQQLEESLKKLDPQAVIVLQSCATAKQIKNGWENIAQKIARIAEGRKVICATDSFYDVKIKNLSPLSIELLALRQPKANASILKRFKYYGALAIEAAVASITLRQFSTTLNVATSYEYNKASAPPKLITDFGAYIDDLYAPEA